MLIETNRDGTVRDDCGNDYRAVENGQSKAEIIAGEDHGVWMRLTGDATRE